MLINPILSDQLLFTTTSPTFADLILTDFAGGSETIDEILDDIIPEGILDAFTVNDATGITITWSAGEVWDSANKTIAEVTAEATPQNCTDDAINFLKWVSGTTLTLSTALPSGTDVLIASINCADGDIWEINQIPIVSDIIGELAVAFQEIFPSLISSGLIVSEHADDEAFDVDMTSGVYFNRIYGREAVSQKDSSIGNDLLTTWYKSAAGEWTATAAQSEIDETQWNNGTALAGVGTPNWYRSLFFVTAGGINWVYPTAEYTTKAQAIAGPDPELPAGLTDHPKSTVLILQWNAAALPTAAGDQWIDVRPIIGSTVSGDFSDHGNLAGLGDDDHIQYILHSLADAASDFLVASGDNVFIKKTLAETGAILEGDIDHGNLQGLDTGTDHSYIDQDVTTSASPQFAGVNLGHASDTTLTRVSSGVIAIEGDNVVMISNSVDVLDDVDTVTSAPATNEVLKWDGNNWIPGTAGLTGEFTFSISSFSDALTIVQIGGGEWKAIDAVTFTIVYNYGPATGANITMSSDDAELSLWGTNPLVLPSDYTSDTNASAMDYPDTVNNYIKFALSADKNGDNDTDDEYVYFRNKKYYGFSATTGQLDSTETLALSGSGFVTASVNNLDTAAHTQTPTGTQYLHFLWPDRLSPSNAGTTMFEINGFPTAFTNNGTFTFDNDVGTGYQETYIDYEAPFGYDAALTFEVKADA